MPSSAVADALSVGVLAASSAGAGVDAVVESVGAVVVLSVLDGGVVVVVEDDEDGGVVDGAIWATAATGTAAAARRIKRNLIMTMRPI
jgi:hypothetical protein